MVVEHPVYYTGGKRVGQSESGAGFGFEAGQRTAPSGCGRASPEAEAWGSEEGRIQGSGQERRVMGPGAALWGSEGPAWGLPACSVAGWLDLASEAVHRHLLP